MFDLEDRPSKERKDRNPAWDNEEQRGENEDLRVRLRIVLVAIVVIYFAVTIGAAFVLASGQTEPFMPGKDCGDGVCQASENPFSCSQDCLRTFSLTEQP